MAIEFMCKNLCGRGAKKGQGRRERELFFFCLLRGEEVGIGVEGLPRSYG